MWKTICSEKKSNGKQILRWNKNWWKKLWKIVIYRNEAVYTTASVTYGWAGALMRFFGFLDWPSDGQTEWLIELHVWGSWRPSEAHQGQERFGQAERRLIQAERGLCRPSQDDQGSLRPINAQRQSSVIQADQGSSRPIKSHQGQSRPIQANPGLSRPIEAR